MTDDHSPTADAQPSPASVSEINEDGRPVRVNGEVINNGGKGVAGRTDYSSWDRKAASLLADVEAEDDAEAAESSAALGQDRAPRSQAEADNRKKAADLRNTKKALEGYEKREAGIVQILADALSSGTQPGGGDRAPTRYVTRDLMEAGRRILTISDTIGPGHVVLTEDLSNIESEVAANASLTPKAYEGDAANALAMEQERTRKVQGLIKVSILNLKDCTVTLRCKVLTATVEISRCTNVILRVERGATVATVQADLCEGLCLEFRDAPSGKNHPSPSGRTTLFWGEDKNDRVYHAGVSNLTVATYRDGFVDLETAADYLEMGAKAVGNATPEEVQFITSVVDGKLLTERVVRTGSYAGGSGSARAMTEREAREQERKKEELMEKAVEYARKEMGQGGEGGGLAPSPRGDADGNGGGVTPGGEEVVEEIYSSMSRERIDATVVDCDAQKGKGNEAFSSGEYAQSVLYYTMALDRAAELPDHDEAEAIRAGGSKEVAENVKKGPKGELAMKQMYPRHVILSNRSAAFLKLGDHERALADAELASALDPTYVKGVFRRGLALHAMKQYEAAIPALAEAHKIEPKNKQIRQALTFAEAGMQREMRKRMGGA